MLVHLDAGKGFFFTSSSGGQGPLLTTSYLMQLEANPVKKLALQNLKSTETLVIKNITNNKLEK